MKNTFTSFTNAFSRGLTAFPVKLKVSGGATASLKKRAETLAREAKRWSRRGGLSCEKQLAQFQAEVEDQKNTATADKRIALKRDKKALTIAQKQQASFDKDAAIDKHRNATAIAKAEEKVRLEKEKTRTAEELRQAKERQYEKEEEQEDYEAKQGKIGEPGPFNRNPVIAIGITTCADIFFTVPAMIAANIMPIIAILSSFVLSFSLAYSSHGLGKDSFKKSIAGQRIWVAVGLSILIFIAAIRIESLINLLSVLIMAALWVAGARASYLYYEKKQGFDIKMAKEKADTAVLNTIGRQTEVEASFNSLSERYEYKVKKDADNDKDRIDTEVARLETAIETQEEDITSINASYDKAFIEGKAIIEAGFEKGRRKYNGGIDIGGQPTQTIAAAVLMVLLLFTGACKNSTMTSTPETHCTYGVIDKSLSIRSSGYRESIATFSNYVKTVNGYTTDEYYSDGIQCVFYFTGDYSIPPSIKVSLAQGKPYALSNVPVRDSVVNAFFSRQLPDTITKALSLRDTMYTTHLHRGTAHAFSQLNTCGAQHRTLLVLTDAIETGVLNMGKYTPDELHQQQDTIIQQLLADTPLPDLKGIEVLLLVQTHPSYDNISYRSALIFKAMWEQKGAQVKIQNNL